MVKFHENGLAIAVPELPLMVPGEPSDRAAPWEGELIADVGAAVSVGAVAAVSPGISVACCMAESVLPVPAPLSRPHAHCTVPAPNTMAPLDARYKVRWWVAVLLSWVVLP